MAYKIKQSRQFNKDIIALLSYLEKEWGYKVATDFQDFLDGRLLRLSHFPEAGRITAKNTGVRKLVITKQNKLYYKIKGKTVYLLTLFDTRQNPKRNKYE
jgi:plasmid stabilization system protein ParE